MAGCLCVNAAESCLFGGECQTPPCIPSYNKEKTEQGKTTVESRLFFWDQIIVTQGGVECGASLRGISSSSRSSCC